jgi:septum formation protein
MSEQVTRPVKRPVMRPFILASSSPRRREILGSVGVPFRTVPAHLDEDAFARQFQGTFPDLVEALAVAKARAVASAEPTFDGWVLAADTTVILEGEMLGKPQDAEDAVRLLRRLRGRVHQVATGVALVDSPGGRVVSGQRCAQVWMRAYSDEEIAAYVETGDPLDKAGAYAVQHRLFHPVERVEGCYLTVVGLPLCLVRQLLALQGGEALPLPGDVARVAGADDPAAPQAMCIWSPRCVAPLPLGATFSDL